MEGGRGGSGGGRGGVVLREGEWWGERWSGGGERWSGGGRR